MMTIMELVPPNFSWVHMWGAQALKSFSEVDAKRVAGLSAFETVHGMMQSNLKKKDEQKGISRLSKGKDFSEGLHWAGSELMKMQRFAT